jgi:hypothetical protein
VALTRDQLNRFLDRGLLVGPMPAPPPATVRYHVAHARADGVLLEGKSRWWSADPNLLPVGVRPLSGPPEAIDLVRPMLESGSLLYVSDITAPSVWLRAEPNEWCVYKPLYGGPPKDYGRFASADEAVERVLGLLYCGLVIPETPPNSLPGWRTSDTLGLARGIYEDRAFDRLPLLADALMDAGCDDEQILAHCHSPGPHVRGCWVVDLVLGKA